jgi:hypothetical protein
LILFDLKHLSSLKTKGDYFGSYRFLWLGSALLCLLSAQLVNSCAYDFVVHISMEPKVQFCISSELAALPNVGTTNCLATKLAALDLPTNWPEYTSTKGELGGTGASQNFGVEP